MGFLTVISETGISHSASLLRSARPPVFEWRGFHWGASPRWVPARSTARTARRTSTTTRALRGGRQLFAALQRTDPSRARSTRSACRDCVSLSADIARWCGLSVPRALE